MPLIDPTLHGGTAVPPEDVVSPEMVGPKVVPDLRPPVPVTSVGQDSQAAAQGSAIAMQGLRTPATDPSHNMLIGLAVVAALLAMALSLWLTMFLVKRARRQLKIVKQHIETRRVSRVAEDEAIREVVRNSVQKADDKSLDTLRSQIKAALDSGDTKTAEELLRILNRLNQE